MKNIEAPYWLLGVANTCKGCRSSANFFFCYLSDTEITGINRFILTDLCRSSCVIKTHPILFFSATKKKKRGKSSLIVINSKQTANRFSKHISWNCLSPREREYFLFREKKNWRQSSLRFGKSLSSDYIFINDWRWKRLLLLPRSSL